MKKIIDCIPGWLMPCLSIALAILLIAYPKRYYVVQKPDGGWRVQIRRGLLYRFTSDVAHKSEADAINACRSIWMQEPAPTITEKRVE